MSTPHTPADGTPDSKGDLTIRFEDEEITTDTLGTALIALTRLHTKLWLARAGRFDDVIAYSTTHDVQYDEQANLVIRQITMNSPFAIILATSKILGDSIAHIIDGVAQAPLRWKREKLKNDLLAIEVKKNELALRAQELALETQEQTAPYQVEAIKIKIDQDMMHLLKEKAETQEAILQAETGIVANASSILRLQIDGLYPDLDPTSKSMLVQSTLPEALQFGNFNVKAVYTIHHTTHEEVAKKQGIMKKNAPKIKLKPRPTS